MIEHGKLFFRAIEEEDLPLLRDWRNKDYVRKGTREYRLLNMINQREWLKHISLTKPPSDIMFLILNWPKLKPKPLGVCGLVHIDWKERNAETSVYIGEPLWQRKGMASGSLKFLLDYGFKTLGLHRIWVEIYGNNEPSIKLFEKAGFKLEGELRDSHWDEGRFWNSLIYSILRDEFCDTSVQTVSK